MNQELLDLLRSILSQVIAGFIHLKYSVDNEIALTNKGIANANDPEYIEYREFVAEVKLFVG